MNPRLQSKIETLLDLPSDKLTEQFIRRIIIKELQFQLFNKVGRNLPANFVTSIKFDIIGNIIIPLNLYTGIMLYTEDFELPTVVSEELMEYENQHARFIFCPGVKDGERWLEEPKLMVILRCMVCKIYSPYDPSCLIKIIPNKSIN
jgi:hypothetical protein